MRHLRTLLLASIIAAIGVVPVAGQQDGPKLTVVQSVQADVAGTAIAVAADVDWGGTAPSILGTDPAGDAPPAANATGPHGLDLVAISAWIEDGNELVATLAWHLATFDRPPPPEIVRYYMTFQLGGQAFALQAKTSDFVSGANLSGDPATVAQRLASYAEHIAATGTLPEFRVRGNCETIVALQNCGHVAWVLGEFDTAANQIRIHVPLDLAAMPALRPGATLNTDQGAWASLQPVADAAQTRDTMPASAQTGLPWTIPTRTANATLSDLDGNVVAGPMTLAVAADGSVSGQLGASGLDPGDYSLTVVACIEGNCDSGSATVTI